MPQTRFSKIETNLSEDKRSELYESFEKIISELGANIKNKKDLSDIFSDSFRHLRPDDMLISQKPEEFTKNFIINPLLKILEFEDNDFIKETKQTFDESRRWADYTIKVDNNFVLLEAKALNIDLYAKDSAISQVREWLISKQTPTNYGIATDGFLWIMVKFDEDVLRIQELKTINLRPVFLELIGQKNLMNVKELLDDFYLSLSKTNIIHTFKEESYQLEMEREKISQSFYSHYMDYIFGVNSKDGSTIRQYSLLTAVKPSSSSSDLDIRLFCINFMNRILFIKFLEDKGLIENNLLLNLWQEYSTIRSKMILSFYKLYLQPLFFEVFNTPIKDRSSEIRRIGHYNGIPYLNGGLFRESIKNEKDFDIENDILEKIILEFLQNYDFTISGEKGLDPDILGNIFEKTINYITKLGTQRQKALGAYYTPDDVTNFICDSTIYPYLMKKIKDSLLNSGWKESELREYSNLDFFLSNLPRNSSDVRRALEVVREITVLDPACGSGHFLTTALKKIVHIKKSLLKAIGEDTNLYSIKRETIGHNLFGVDIEGPAVEIAKLRLWLSLIEDMDINDKEHIQTLPNIEFNIMQGDSLVGWINEKGQKFISKLIDDDQVKTSLEGLDLAYSSDEDKHLIIEKAKEDFDTYDTEKILTSYTALRSIYPLESPLKAKKLGVLLERIRKSLYGFITQNYSAYLNDMLTPNKKRKLSKKPGISSSELVGVFHWGVDFHLILKDGFDVIIGNPPYIEKSKLPETTRKVLGLYKTEEAGNTHAYFYERSLSLLRKGGYCGLIVPISAVATDRMASLQNLLLDHGRNLWISNYDDRPGKIFGDLEHCRSSIIILEKKGEQSEKSEVYTTTYNRWYTEDRDSLFQIIEYAKSTNYVVDGSIPKLGKEIEKSILKKIYTNKPLMNYLGNQKDTGQVWFHNAPQYWIRAIDFVSYFWNEKEGEKISDQLIEINVEPSKYAKVVSTVLNSSLFYLFFTLYSDGRHLNLREIYNFPISLDKINSEVIKQLNILASELMEDYKKNANRKVCSYATTGKVIYDEFFPGKSKYIIDKIDDVLADHYKFSKEEKEYIKNYSIEFRLGEEE